VIYQADTSGSGCYQIFSMTAAGTSIKQLTDGPGCNWAPAWSPDGARIAFSTNRHGNFQVAIMNADGSAPKQVTSDPGRNDAFPSFSPDGRTVLFTSWDSELRGDSADIFQIGVNGSDRRQLTTSPNDDSYPTWSPDGAWIAFQSARDGNLEIYAMPADGSTEVRLTNDPADDTGAVWR
jgi:TolB protein